MTKTIMQILPSLESGGVERGVIDLSKELKKQGFNPIVVSSGGALVYNLKEAGIAHIILDVKTKNPLKIYKNIKILQDLITQNKVDLVHIRSRAPMISGYYACKNSGVKLVSTVHGPYSLTIFKNKDSKLKKFYNSFMVKSDKIIAVSNFIKDYILQNYGDLCDAKKISVIARGVDLKAFDPDAIFVNRTIELAKKWGIPEDKKIILFPARITSWKGHEFLIEALKKVKSDFICIFAGSDHGHEEFKKKIQQKIIDENLAGKIKFVGAINDMAVTYQLANLVISASIKPEAFGRVAIEAQAMKKVIIATKIGGSLETIIDKKTGFLVKNGDVNALAKLIDKVLKMKDEETKAIGEAARINVEKNFSNQLMYQRTIEVYKKMF